MHPAIGTSHRTSQGPSIAEPTPTPRFLSREECEALIRRAIGFAAGGGVTTIGLSSSWTGNLRWARNRIISSGDVRANQLGVSRRVDGVEASSRTNSIDDRHLLWTIRRAERAGEMHPVVPEPLRGEGPFIEPYSHPKIWFATTYDQDAAARADVMHELVQPAVNAGMHAAGYIQVAAIGQSTMDGDRVWYYPYTQAQYSVTVRTPSGDGSGWAGVDWNDWARIDAKALSATALDKCLRSRNPVRLEPGRYTTILEPQAAGDLAIWLFNPSVMDREYAEYGDPTYERTSPYFKDDPHSPFNLGQGYSKLGEKVIDERLTVATDPMDPDLGFPPFAGWQVYHPAVWIQDGVLKELSYYRDYAVKHLGVNTGGLPLYGSPESGSFHVHVRGPTVSVDEMVATTKRGVLVTRFSGIQLIDKKSLLLSGYTRDGTWLIENGKISHPIKNFRFTDSPFFAFNSVEEIGVPQRIFNPGYPVVVPPLKVRDFSFTSLSDAV